MSTAAHRRQYYAADIAGTAVANSEPVAAPTAVRLLSTTSTSCGSSAIQPDSRALSLALDAPLTAARDNYSGTSSKQQQQHSLHRSGSGSSVSSYEHSRGRRDSYTARDEHRRSHRYSSSSGRRYADSRSRSRERAYEGLPRPSPRQC
jgi:hypothetical protein